MKKYRITLTERQMEVVETALEEYFRLRMGQDFDFTYSMASLTRNPSAKGREDDEAVNCFVSRRERIGRLMRQVFSIAFEPFGYLKKKTEEMLIAQDIWDAIRMTRGISKWDSILKTSPEPVPVIEAVEEKTS